MDGRALYKLTDSPDRRHRSSVRQPSRMSSAAREDGVGATELLVIPYFSCRDEWRRRGYVCSLLAHTHKKKIDTTLNTSHYPHGSESPRPIWCGQMGLGTLK